MYGDLQAVAGKALGEFNGFTLTMPEDLSKNDDDTIVGIAEVISVRYIITPYYGKSTRSPQPSVTAIIRKSTIAHLLLCSARKTIEPTAEALLPTEL